MNTPELTLQGPVATIRLRRPQQANRLDPDDLATLLSHIEAVNARPEVLVLRLEAEGKYFCSGYDLSRLSGAKNIPFDEVVNALEDARPVTLALIHGGVYGGGTDLALACDFRLGIEGIDMFMPAARLGLHFYQRGLERYVSRLGLNHAKRLFLTAERIDARTMLDMGFLTHLDADPQTLQNRAEALTTTLAGMAPIALLGMKKHLNLLARHALNSEDLRRDILAAARSNDLREGQRAWAEKRAPKFTGT